MNLNDYKTEFCFRQVQVVIFNAGGQLLESCDTLIPVNKFHHNNLFEMFPVLESIKGSLSSFVAGANEKLILPRVEFPFENQYFICDFHFSAIHYQNQNACLWILHNLTEQYNYLFLVQQERNETIIEAQNLKIENEILSLQKDITLLNNLRQIRRNLNATITAEIEAPLNRIMALANKMKETAASKKEYNNFVSMESAVSIIDDQLTQSRPMQLDLLLVPPDRTETNLQELLWNVLKIFNYRQRAKESPVYLNFKPGLPQTVLVNKPRLAQLFHNFFEYALFGWGSTLSNLSASLQEMKPTYCKLEFMLTNTINPLSEQEIAGLSEKMEEDLAELARTFKGRFDIFVLPDDLKVIMTLHLVLRLGTPENIPSS
ncbi:sensor histidine kinase [Sphingobacteriales bacterium UPWRP_1]|nr:hypothetical protein BVG80_09860 [Sphingobacteriales bacterium TSM_CSM]PSJ78131.1 sensor histidine kinase [Sphingobacteriales bacterium UPWRP_1]